MNTWRGPTQPPQNVRQAAEKLLKDSEELCTKFASLQQCGLAQAAQLGDAGPPLQEQAPTFGQRIGVVLGQIEGMTVPVNAWQLDELAAIKAPLEQAAAQTKQVTDALAALNKMMNEAGIPHIRPTGGGGGGGGFFGAEPPETDKP
jgi:hypothetical protein